MLFHPTLSTTLLPMSLMSLTSSMRFSLMRKPVHLCIQEVFKSDKTNGASGQKRLFLHLSSLTCTISRSHSLCMWWWRPKLTVQVSVAAVLFIDLMCAVCSLTICNHIHYTYIVLMHTRSGEHGANLLCVHSSPCTAHETWVICMFSHFPHSCS